MRSRWIIISIVLSISTVSSWAEEVPATGTILSWQKNFVRSSLGAKLEIIKDASKSQQVTDFGPLFDQALDFATDNYELLSDDPLTPDLVAFAADGLAKTTHTTSISKLWRAFMSWREANVRVPVLRALSVLGRGDGQVIENLNQYLATQNSVFGSGMAPDLETLAASIEALGRLNSASSFSVLFSTMVAGYPADIQEKASKAIRLLDGDYRKNLIGVIRRNPPVEKLAAFREGTENPETDPDLGGEMAEVALEVSLQIIEKGDEPEDAIKTLRRLAVRELTHKRWSRATPLLIRHFHLVQSPQEGQELDRDSVIDAIKALGVMGDSRAAQVLSLYLGLLNSEMERSKTWDDRILPATIEALGDLGDKMAFDYLLYTGYLPYPDDIKALARAALNRLKW